ncbi:DUF202 domain-containing protein [Pseudonocardia sp. H11422]|uniref:DUF202 domain-containing protein n=1 Tax=Pseudonocardia sp. H11422 TaxID=2835866 RepID=UPI001BDC1391|nr:DUF202 domain-containing protein [Pseudonocardia sp. H11422]
MSRRPATGLLDPAAQSERTLLAWSRTALTVGAVAAFLLRITADQQFAIGVAAALALIAAGAALYVAGHRRYRRLLRDVPAGRPVTVGPVMALTVGVVLALCAASVLSIAH